MRYEGQVLGDIVRWHLLLPVTTAAQAHRLSTLRHGVVPTVFWGTRTDCRGREITPF
jgi:hypothetical protein